MHAASKEPSCKCHCVKGCTASSPSPVLPLEATSHDSHTSVREGVVAGFVAVLVATGSSSLSTPRSVCFPSVFWGTSLGNRDWHGVKQHGTSSAWLVGDFLGHKPSCRCGFFRTHTCWAAAQPARWSLRLQPECQVEVTDPELAQTLGEMEASFFSLSPGALDQGQVVRNLGWHSQFRGAAP